MKRTMDVNRAVHTSFFRLSPICCVRGQRPAPCIALITAKVLLSPIRVFSYEAPLLGWPMTFARLVRFCCLRYSAGSASGCSNYSIANGKKHDVPARSRFLR